MAPHSAISDTVSLPKVGSSKLIYNPVSFMLSQIFYSLFFILCACAGHVPQIRVRGQFVDSVLFLYHVILGITL